MTDNITTAIGNVTTADWAAIVIALVAIIISIIFSAKNIKLNKLITLIQVIWQEMSNEEASKDRGLVKEITSTEIKEIKKLVLSGRDKNNKTADAERGRAVERTVARFDRVSFFLLGHGNKPIIEPPIWLWTLEYEIWEKVSDWVKHRQSDEKDKDFYHKNYGYYFQKLENYRTKHKL